MLSTKDQIAAVKSALSAPRISTYEFAAGTVDNEDPSALDLHLWNAQISGAFLTPLHICEVVIRNAIADALEKNMDRDGHGHQRLSKVFHPHQWVTVRVKTYSMPGEKHIRSAK